jgi:hypothetical protein
MQDTPLLVPFERLDEILGATDDAIAHLMTYTDFPRGYRIGHERYWRVADLRAYVESGLGLPDEGDDAATE